MIVFFFTVITKKKSLKNRINSNTTIFQNYILYLSGNGPQSKKKNEHCLFFPIMGRFRSSIKGNFEMLKNIGLVGDTLAWWGITCGGYVFWVFIARGIGRGYECTSRRFFLSPTLRIQIRGRYAEITKFLIAWGIRRGWAIRQRNCASSSSDHFQSHTTILIRIPS